MAVPRQGEAVPAPVAMENDAPARPPQAASLPFTGSSERGEATFPPGIQGTAPTPCSCGLSTALCTQSMAGHHSCLAVPLEAGEKP